MVQQRCSRHFIWFNVQAQLYGLLQVVLSCSRARRLLRSVLIEGVCYYQCSCKSVFYYTTEEFSTERDEAARALHGSRCLRRHGSYRTRSVRSCEYYVIGDLSPLLVINHWNTYLLESKADQLALQPWLGVQDYNES